MYVQGTLYRPWTTRKFYLGINHTLSYFDEKNTLKGTLYLEGAQVRTLDPSEADSRMFAFEVLVYCSWTYCVVIYSRLFLLLCNPFKFLLYSRDFTTCRNQEVPLIIRTNYVSDFFF